MATSICSSVVLLATIVLMAISPSSIIALPTSTISAAPAILPNAPLTSPGPNLSPDITPLFPTPGGSDGLSPTESSLPIIPSSPSPPNPDSTIAPGPDMAFSPTGFLPVLTSDAPYLSGSSSNLVTLVLGLLAFGFLQIFRM